MNIALHLRRAALAHAERPALAIAGRVVADYATLGDRAARIAGALRGQLGLAQGARVALVLRNCPHWVVFDQAALSLGLVVVPLYTDDRPDNIRVADSRGWQTHLFEGPEGWAARLVAEGLLSEGEAR